MVPDDGCADDQKTYLAKFGPGLLSNAVTLLDPDNGLEAKSARGRKYVRYEEVRGVFENLAPNGTLIVYQHLPREQRPAYLARTGTSLRERCATPGVLAVSPNNCRLLHACERRGTNRRPAGAPKGLQRAPRPVLVRTHHLSPRRQRAYP